MVFATVILPGILIFFYLLFFASQSYISETRFAIRGQTGAPNLEGLGALFNLSQGALSDSYIVADYIVSPDMFEKLDEKLKLRDHYSDRKWDIWYRLARDASKDDIADFWQWACEASFDPDTGILGVQVKAFTPDMALAVCQGILSESEALVNAMNARARRDAMSQALAEVTRAEERIRKARDALHAYRQSTAVLDPAAVTSGLYGLVNKLEGEVAKTAAELSEAMTFMNKGSPRVRQLKNRLKVLEKKLADEKTRLAGSLAEGQSVNDMLAGFQKLALEEEFAQKQLTSAMSSLEAARVRADAQTQYVEAFERPVLADESLYPRPFLFTCIYMITALLLLGLVSLIIAAVREHAGF
ncbi:MAG: capsule biosynthesis protein [Desulfovibrionaceae bacterium]|nr:capsule biosynthesis protein [Desulfovibrionaceae bacterium]